MRVRAARPVLAGAGLLFLLAVVALATSRRGPGGGDGDERSLDAGLLDVVFTLALIAALLTIVLLVMGIRLRREGDEDFDLRRMLLVAGVFVAFFLAIALGASLLVDENVQRGQQPSHLDQGIPRQSPELSAPRGSLPAAQPRDVGISWLTVGIVVGALAGAAAIVVGRRWWRRLRFARRERSATEAVREVLQAAIDDLEAERDPRRAVIKAYARMERTLAVHGLPRRPPEAPLEYTARVLTELHASRGSVRALTDLFERAKFSTHEIAERDRREAVRALGAVRDELGEAA